MNLNDIKTTIQLKSGYANLYLRKHSPEILLGAGLIGMVATVVMASKATLKAEQILKEHDEQIGVIEETINNGYIKNYSKEDETKDRTIVYVQTGLKFAKLYAPAVGVGVLSIAAILGAHGIMANRQVALVAAYNLLHEGFKNYRQRVVEELGEAKDQAFGLGLREEKITVEELDENGKKVKKKQAITVSTGNMPSIYARCFDMSNPNFRADRNLNQAFLTAQERYINDLLILRGYVFLNEAYERLGFPHTSEGQLVGWVLRSPEQMKAEKRDGYVSFGLDKETSVHSPFSQEFIDETRQGCIWLDFNVDGIVYNLI